VKVDNSARPSSVITVGRNRRVLAAMLPRLRRRSVFNLMQFTLCCPVIREKTEERGTGEAAEVVVNVEGGQREHAIVVANAAAACRPTADELHVVLTLIDAKVAEPPLTVG
jgi:hypothetical protein